MTSLTNDLAAEIATPLINHYLEGWGCLDYNIYLIEKYAKLITVGFAAPLE